MPTDLNKKTLRHFYCRDHVWQCFERMSEDVDRGVDDLVNEAMRVYAREKGYLPAEHESRPTATRSVPPRPPPLPPPSRNTGGRSSPPGPQAAARTTREGALPPLFLIFQNQRYRIDQEQFVIGRGAKSADLPIRDGNISRKHAVVVRKNGAYYIKDLGSTNGIDHNGVRIDNKKIEEGDVFSLCDYQMKFTFR